MTQVRWQERSRSATPVAPLLAAGALAAAFGAAPGLAWSFLASPSLSAQEPAATRRALPPDRTFDSDGVRIRYVEAGEGAPVVLVHGFSVDLELNWVWSGVFSSLAEEFRVIAFDHRGHGKSEKPIARDAYGEEMARDVVRLLDHLEIESAHVVGYSMGAAIATKLLETAPDRVRSLVLGGGGWTRPPEGVTKEKRPGDRIQHMHPVLRRWTERLERLSAATPTGGSVTDAIWVPGWPEPLPETREKLDANDPRALLAVIAGIPELGVAEGVIRRSQTPALLIGGGEDRFFLPVVEAMRGVKPELQVVVLPGLDHVAATMDPALSREILAFLRSRSPERARGAGRVHGLHHPHGQQHAVAEDVRLVADETAPGEITLRLGPLELPARSDHHAVPQAPDRFWEVPFDGWILSYTPRLEDGEGTTAPGRLLHHVAFYHTGRADFLCPNKEEHIFGAGGEMNRWIELPGFGYRVSAGDRIRVNTMFHNPTSEDHRETYLEVRVAYQGEGSGEPRRAVYPTWIDVQECGDSSYDLEPGTNVTTGTMEVPVAGRLLGVGGHLHTHGKELVLTDVEEYATASPAGAPGKEIARLLPETDEAGHILSIPIVPFVATGGYALEAGDVLRVRARYENPTGRRLSKGAMGIVVGYFLPDEDAGMERYRREGG